MLKFKRKKLKFSFQKKKKSYIGSDSPSERRHEELTQEYGDDPAFITAFGVKIFPTGDQFVISAKTGRVIVRDKSTRYLGRDEEKGFHLYLREDENLSEDDEAHPSFVKEKEAM